MFYKSIKLKWSWGGQSPISPCYTEVRRGRWYLDRTKAKKFWGQSPKENKERKHKKNITKKVTGGE